MTEQSRDVVLCGGKRTPFGDFGKSLKDIPGPDLGIHAARATLEASGLDPAHVDHLVCGNVMPVDQGGYFASRVIGLGAGLAEESAALDVSRACGSGTQAIVSATQQIMTGHSSVALAGGYENASRAPYALTGARWGMKRGAGEIVDTIDYGYRDPFDLALMGETAENLTDDFGYERTDMDLYALESQQRAGKAIESGFLAEQIAPIDVPARRGELRRFEVDEFPRPGTTLETLAGLRPVFREDGRVTAGNASGMTDGAAFVVVAERGSAEQLDLRPRARVVDWEVVGVPPRIMGCGPVPAIRRLLDRRDLRVGDIDYYEINEAFAVVNLHAERELGVSRESCNLYGGGISIGHPPGATGVRMSLTAMRHMEMTGDRTAIVSMCLGAGQGMALLLERIDS
ncbi:MAG: thiolase family protein [Actinomycetota bacterium]